MLSVNNIDLFYGASQALWDVSLSAGKGAVTCILGRNGVGKTSLLRAIAGQQSIAAGDIKLEGEIITGLPPHARTRRGVAYVPQGREIFPLLTVAENLKTGFAPLKKADRSISGEIFELFPVLFEMLGRRGGDLSGGQQQQLAIARALVTWPGHKRARNSELLLLTAGKVSTASSKHLKEDGEQFEYLPGNAAVSFLQGSESGLEIFCHREQRKYLAPLRYIGDAASGAGMRRQSRNDFSFKFDIAGSDGLLAGNGAQQAGFTNAVPPENTGNGTFSRR